MSESNTTHNNKKRNLWGKRQQNKVAEDGDIGDGGQGPRWAIDDDVTSASPVMKMAAGWWKTWLFRCCFVYSFMYGYIYI